MTRYATPDRQLVSPIPRLILTRSETAPDDTEELLRRVASETDPDAIRRLRDRVAVLNLGLVDAIAAHYRGRGLEWEDLVQVGRLALVKAILGYHPGQGAGFSAYATPTISGEIKRHFRDHAWGVRPPRRLQELHRELRACEEQLCQSLGHLPSRAELAAAMQVTPEVVDEVQVAQHVTTVVSLDASLGSGPAPSLPDRAEDDPLSRVLTRESLRPAVRHLEGRERRIVHLRFGRGWTQEQIAHELGISQMQVSRLLVAILAKLRADLTSHPRAS